MAERQRGAPERGALGGGGGEGGFNAFSYAVRVQPLITPQSFSAALSLNGTAGSEIEPGWCEPSMAGGNRVHLLKHHLYHVHIVCSWWGGGICVHVVLVTQFCCVRPLSMAGLVQATSEMIQGGS